MATESVKLPRRSSGPRPTYLGNPHMDNMLSMILELAQELWVIEERLNKLEMQSGQQNSGADSVADHTAKLEDFIGKLLRSTLASAEEAVDGVTYEEIVRQISEV